MFAHRPSRAAPGPEFLCIFNYLPLPYLNTTALQIGRIAEALVARYLCDRGYVLLAQNLRVGRDELDLVALEGATLVVVEVRARRKNALVHPLLSLTPAKLDRLRRASRRLMIERGARELRIDVASVIDGEVEYLENAVDFSGK